MRSNISITLRIWAHIVLLVVTFVVPMIDHRDVCIDRMKIIRASISVEENPKALDYVDSLLDHRLHILSG